MPTGRKVLDADDLESLAESVLDAWLTEGRFATAFRSGFAEAARPAGRRAGRLGLAGQPAGDRRADVPVARAAGPVPGDEVITPAVGFPTTINPAIQLGLKPVFVDVEVDTLNPTTAQFAEAIGPRTRAIFAAHCLGNPFDAAALAALCADRDIVLVEDCCDALGSTLDGRLVGTFGALSTYSFYPAHHMTTGEGGAVASDDAVWTRAVCARVGPRLLVSDRRQRRGRRFDGQFGRLPVGFDHKYVFSQVGFNFKITDMQAALGVTQLAKLDGFHAARRHNAARLLTALAPHEEQLILPHDRDNLSGSASP